MPGRQPFVSHFLREILAPKMTKTVTSKRGCESIKKVRKMLLDDRKVKLIEMSDTLKISKKHVGHIDLRSELGDKIAEKSTICGRRKCCFIKISQKKKNFYELGLELFPHQLYSSGLAPLQRNSFKATVSVHIIIEVIGWIWMRYVCRNERHIYTYLIK